MPENWIQLLTLAARALFLLFAALVVLRTGFNLLRQHRARKRLMKQLPDAGMVGEMRDIETDKSYPLPREGVLGGGRGCDIRLKGLRRRQVNFAYVPGKGILLTPCHRRSATWLDGVAISRPVYALHGALLRVGGYTLCMRLFAGLDVPQLGMYEEPWQPAYDEDYYAPAEEGFAPLPVDWQQGMTDGEEDVSYEFAPPPGAVSSPEEAPEDEEDGGFAPPPQPAAAPDDTPPASGQYVRRRRSDRRRNP